MDGGAAAAVSHACLFFTASLQHQGPEALNTAYHEALAAELCRPDAPGGEVAGFFEKQDKTQMAMLPAELRRSLLQSVTEGKVEHLTAQLGEVFRIFLGGGGFKLMDRRFFWPMSKLSCYVKLPPEGETIRSGCRNGSRPGTRPAVCRCLNVR
ncbi:hypothetical protein ACFSQ7_32625 [Paenibacillus rhizoplanae]